MKKLNKLFATVASLCYLLIVAAACERDNDIVIPQTQVNNIAETSVTVGDEMTFTGTNMHLITKVLFGEVEAEVGLDLSVRDRNKLTVVVPAQDETKSVVLSVVYNTSKTLVLSDILEIIVPPVIPTVTTSLPASVMSGNVVELTGTNLNIIKTIKVDNNEVVIRSKDPQGSSISFVAPEVDAESNVSVTLIYDNSIGANQQLPVPGSMTIVPALAPVVTSTLPASVESGETVSLEGTNLDIVTSIRLGENTVAISEKTGLLLTFAAPAVEEETSLTVTLVYTNTLSAGRELTLEGSLVVKPSAIPEPETKVLKWENVIIGAQNTGLSFFNGTTGQVITPCELFDNQTAVDLMMYVNSGGSNMLYGPHNTSSTLKNMLCDGKALGESTGDGKDYSGFRSIETKFRILSASGEQGILADLVKEDKIEEINDALFGSISKPSSSAPAVAVGNVLWFYNAKKEKNGLILIKEINTGETNGDNMIKMNVYYQK